MKPERFQRGSALITTLWAMAFFAVIMASVSWESAQQIRMMQRLNNQLEARVDAVSVMQGLSHQMSEDAEPGADHRAKPWYGAWTEAAYAEDRCSVTISDEEAKININYASGAWLDNFFKMLEEQGVILAGESKKYVTLFQKIKADRRMKSLESLLLEKDFEAVDYKTLMPYVTVYPQTAQFNVNTAEPLIIESFINSLTANYADKQILKGRITEFFLTGSYFIEADLQPNAFIHKLQLPANSTMHMLVQHFLAGITSNSDYWTMSLKRRDGMNIYAVLHLVPGEIYPSILNWQEGR